MSFYKMFILAVIASGIAIQNSHACGSSKVRNLPNPPAEETKRGPEIESKELPPLRTQTFYGKREVFKILENLGNDIYKIATLYRTGSFYPLRSIAIHGGWHLPASTEIKTVAAGPNSHLTPGAKVWSRDNNSLLIEGTALFVFEDDTAVVKWEQREGKTIWPYFESLSPNEFVQSDVTPPPPIPVLSPSEKEIEKVSETLFCQVFNGKPRAFTISLYLENGIFAINALKRSGSLSLFWGPERLGGWRLGDQTLSRTVTHDPDTRLRRGSEVWGRDSEYRPVEGHVLFVFGNKTAVVKWETSRQTPIKPIFQTRFIQDLGQIESKRSVIRLPGQRMAENL